MKKDYILYDSKIGIFLNVYNCDVNFNPNPFNGGLTRNTISMEITSYNYSYIMNWFHECSKKDSSEYKRDIYLFENIKSDKYIFKHCFVYSINIPEKIVEFIFDYYYKGDFLELVSLYRDSRIESILI